MPIDMTSAAMMTPMTEQGYDKHSSRLVSTQDINQFQQALQALAINDQESVVSNASVSAAVAEANGLGEIERKRKESKESFIDRVTGSIDRTLMAGSDHLQTLYHHLSTVTSAEKLAHGPTMLSIQLEVMRATVLIDIITKVANKAATTVDSMIRLQ